MGPLWIHSFTVTDGDFFKIRGKVIKVYQKRSVCEVGVGNFVVEETGQCGVVLGMMVEVTGRVKQTLLSRMLGQVLIDGKLYVYSDSNDKNLFYRVELWFEEQQARLDSLYAKFLPEPEASLMAGVVLGSKKLPYEFKQELIGSGLIHIVVASGFNVMIVGAVMMEMLLYVFRRNLATGLAILVMFLYALLAGFDPPVVRAFIMGSLILLSFVLGRNLSSLWSLGVACLLMVLIEPSIILSVSFQLSVAASFGLVVVAPWLENNGKLRINNYLEALKKLLIPTLSVQILTLPLIYYYFGHVSLWGFLSNILVLPVIPAMMILGVIFLFLVLVYAPLGFLLSWALYSLAHFVTVVVSLFG